jgi:hypothetical protein
MSSELQSNMPLRWLILVALVGLASSLPLRADPQEFDPPTLLNSFQFVFDFSLSEADAREIQEIQLHVSTDRGRSWRFHRSVTPDRNSIPFEANRDGEYWFAVQQVYKDGQKRPITLNEASTQRKVVVDTTPPAVELRPVRSGNKVGVEWTIRSDDVDLGTLRLMTRRSGSSEWIPVGISPGMSGRQMWELDPQGPQQVRLRVLDRATNEANPTVTLTGWGDTSVDPVMGSGDRSASSLLNEPPAPTFGTPSRSSFDGGVGSSPSASRSGRLVAPGSDPSLASSQPGWSTTSDSAINAPTVPTQYVNKYRFQIKYKTENLGKSGVKEVHLYWRHADDRQWEHYGPNVTVDPPFRVAVDGEGKYGICLRAVSGVGLGEDAPTAVDPPQLWVVVDVTPPVVRLATPQVRHGPKPEVLISWQSNDANLGERKIKLSYSAVNGPDAGVWKEIVRDQPNVGQYRWQPPDTAPYLFHVRAEATDAAGNTAHDSTKEPVAVDNARPKAIAIAAEPFGDSADAGVGNSNPNNAKPDTPTKKAPSASPVGVTDEDDGPLTPTPPRSNSRTEKSAPPPVPDLMPPPK